MSGPFAFHAEIERADATLEVKVTYSVTPFTRATYWQPAEGGEVEFVSVMLGGVAVVISEAEEAELLRQCGERAESDVSEAAADHADHVYERARDDRMTHQETK